MKDRKIERVTHYEYDENGELKNMTINETITNPSDEECGIKTEITFSDVSLAIAGLGLCLTAISTIIKHK